MSYLYTQTHTHAREHKHTQIYAQKRLPPSGFETHLGGMWRNPPSPKRDQCLVNRLLLPVLIGCWLLNWIGGLLLGDWRDYPLFFPFVNQLI